MDFQKRDFVNRIGTRRLGRIDNIEDGVALVKIFKPDGRSMYVYWELSGIEMVSQQDANSDPNYRKQLQQFMDAGLPKNLKWRK